MTYPMHILTKRFGPRILYIADASPVVTFVEDKSDASRFHTEHAERLLHEHPEWESEPTMVVGDVQ